MSWFFNVFHFHVVNIGNFTFTTSESTLACDEWTVWHIKGYMALNDYPIILVRICSWVMKECWTVTFYRAKKRRSSLCVEEKFTYLLALLMDWCHWSTVPTMVCTMIMAIFIQTMNTLRYYYLYNDVHFIIVYTWRDVLNYISHISLRKRSGFENVIVSTVYSRPRCINISYSLSDEFLFLHAISKISMFCFKIHSRLCPLSKQCFYTNVRWVRDRVTEISI